MTGELGDGNEMRVELKYCERCGVLWLRDPSGGQVYCDYCRPRMDELPVRKKRPGSIRLACGRRPLLREGKLGTGEANVTTMPVAGGAA
jgi:hypothetical protein